MVRRWGVVGRRFLGFGGGSCSFRGCFRVIGVLG